MEKIFVNSITNEWTLTDPDNEQWGRKISDTIYEFYENDSGSRDQPFLIDLDTYGLGEIESTINSYGYSLLPYSKNYILNIYNRLEACWIIAECLFECDNLKAM